MGNACKAKIIPCCGQINEDFNSENPNLEILSKDIKTLNLKKEEDKKNIQTSNVTNGFFDDMAIRSSSLRSKDLTLNTNSIDNNTKEYDRSFSPIEKILTSPLIYEKMISGERIHNYLESFISSENKSLLKGIKNLLQKIKNINFRKNFKKVNEIYTFFNNCFIEINDKKIINNIEKDIDESQIKTKFYLIDILELLVEIYHFFQFQLANGKEPYDEFYWYNIKDLQIYIKNKIASTFREIENLNNYLIEKKLMNTNINLSKSTSKLTKIVKTEKLYI